MPHVLFVCTANICRSPIAEGLLRQQLITKGMTDWSVGSAGTWAVDRRPPARHGIQLMAEQGVDISGRTAQMVDATSLDQADLVLCMEQGHVEALSVEFPQAAHKIHLLSELAAGSPRYDIKDPFGQDIEMYRQLVAELSQLINEGLPKIVLLGEQNARRTG